MRELTRVNKLCLGTVQFGMNYGIKNFDGKPSEFSIQEMLNYALDAGIRSFDTAMAYGDAQRKLGRYLPDDSSIKVYTKIPPNILLKQASNNKAVIVEQMMRSLESLRRDKVEGLYLHNADDIYSDGVIDGLIECKRQGLVERVGISGYESKPIIDGVNGYGIDMYQMPYNVLDQRLEREVLREIESKCLVFARSVFLQGLLLMNEDQIIASVPEAVVYIKAFHEISSKYEMNPIRAAMSFVLGNGHVDYLVFGVDNIRQLKKNIDIVQKAEMQPECRKEVEERFIDIDKKIIFPFMW